MHQVGKKDYHYIRMDGQQNIKKCRVLVKAAKCVQSTLLFAAHKIITLTGFPFFCLGRNLLSAYKSEV